MGKNAKNRVVSKHGSLDQRIAAFCGHFNIAVVEQITKADRIACHALRGKGKARATLRRLSFTVLRSKIKDGNSLELRLFRSNHKFDNIR